MARKKRTPAVAAGGWITTYADMVTLMMCFFVMLYNPSEVDPVQMQALTASISGDPSAGGQSLAAGRLSDLGNTINSMPAMEKGKSLGLAVKKAISMFAPDIKSSKINVTSDERGLVITLAADSFFKPGSATLDIEEVRDILLRIAQFLSSQELAGKKFRVEGHTDNSIVDSAQWESNWELSASRAINILQYLSDFGVNEKQFSVAGYADTRPKFSNDTAEGRAYNRRVDIIILDDGHF